MIVFGCTFVPLLTLELCRFPGRPLPFPPAPPPPPAAEAPVPAAQHCTGGGKGPRAPLPPRRGNRTLVTIQEVKIILRSTPRTHGLQCHARPPRCCPHTSPRHFIYFYFFHPYLIKGEGNFSGLCKNTRSPQETCKLIQGTLPSSSMLRLAGSFSYGFHTYIIELHTFRENI